MARPTARPVVVQRQSMPAPTPPAPPPALPVPIQPTAAAPPHAAPRTTTVARTATASPPARQPTTETTAAPAPESPTHLDELARRLVTPLSRLLRAELRADRERVGRLRDHGH
ncbi:hypothetical protein [Streptomyces sp. NPDC012756]|uniref:hypothetical protein n=1 Tax=Streptomyces sp. NPDC012756 TaxID=3364847 RepID=UPI0036A3A5F1